MGTRAPDEYFAKRLEAFETDAPDGWWPDNFDEVWLPARTPFVLVPRGLVIRWLAMDVFEIGYRYQFSKRVQLEIADLRPTGFKIERRDQRVLIVRKAGGPLQRIREVRVEDLQWT